jgi:hypothetical protein
MPSLRKEGLNSTSIQRCKLAIERVQLRFQILSGSELRLSSCPRARELSAKFQCNDSGIRVEEGGSREVRGGMMYPRLGIV